MSTHLAGGPSGPPVSMRIVRSVILAGLSTLAVRGCAPRIPEAPPPPSAIIQFVQRPGAPTVTRAQAVWIGNRILTAAHVLVPDHEDPVLVSEFLLNGEPVRVLDALSGDLHTLARVYPRHSRSAPHSPSEWLEDWVVAEVSRSVPGSASLRICDRPIRPGDRLFAVGFPPDEEKPRLRTLPLTVLDFSVEGDWEENEDAEEAALERLVAVRSSTRHDLRGWSGSFVGRYDARAEQWCYVGLLIFGVDNGNGDHLVLRPPPEALRLLMGQDPITSR